MSEIPAISSAHFHFVQDGNTMGTTEELEILDVHLEYQMPEERKGDDAFIVLKSQGGWSINEPDDLNRLLKSCVRAVGQVSREV